MGARRFNRGLVPNGPEAFVCAYFLSSTFRPSIRQKFLAPTAAPAPEAQFSRFSPITTTGATMGSWVQSPGPGDPLPGRSPPPTSVGSVDPFTDATAVATLTTATAPTTTAAATTATTLTTTQIEFVLPDMLGENGRPSEPVEHVNPSSATTTQRPLVDEPSAIGGDARVRVPAVSWQPLGPSDRFRFTAQTLPPFRQCEEEHLGMHRWKKLQARSITLCSGGVSKITCVRQLPSPKVYVCEFHNIVELLAPQGTLRWVAQCFLQKEVDRRLLFNELSPKHPLLNLDIRRELGAKQLSKAITIVESIPGNADLADHVVASLQWKARKNATTREGLTFLSTGDCNTGNPGHCQADQDNLFIVQHMLPTTFGREDTRVVLYIGFGTSRYGARNPGRPHFFEDWKALASEVITASHMPEFPTLSLKSEAYVQPVGTLVTGPAGMTGPHWTRFNQPGLCEGRNPILLGHQMVSWEVSCWV